MNTLKGKVLPIFSILILSALFVPAVYAQDAVTDDSGARAAKPLVPSVEIISPSGTTPITWAIGTSKLVRWDLKDIKGAKRIQLELDDTTGEEQGSHIIANFPAYSTSVDGLGATRTVLVTSRLVNLSTARGAFSLPGAGSPLTYNLRIKILGEDPVTGEDKVIIKESKSAVPITIPAGKTPTSPSNPTKPTTPTATLPAVTLKSCTPTAVSIFNEVQDVAKDIPLNSTVTWTAVAEGLDASAPAGTYKYVWTGTAGKDGSKLSGELSAGLTYDKRGRKTARLQIKAGTKVLASIACNPVNVMSPDAPKKPNTPASAAAKVTIASCSPMVNGAVATGDLPLDTTVTWTATGVTGFDPAVHTYVWTGTVGKDQAKLPGGALTSTMTYDKQGQKSAKLQVKAGTRVVGSVSCTPVRIARPAKAATQSVTVKSCNPNVADKENVALNAPVSWSVNPADVIGLVGGEVYEWTGSAGAGGTKLSGDLTSSALSYDKPGTKTARLKIKSGAKTLASVQCEPVKVVKPVAKAMEVSCNAVPGAPFQVAKNSSQDVSANFSVTVSPAVAEGGALGYTYQWTAGNQKGGFAEFAASWKTPGKHTARVKVTNPNTGKSKTVNCSVMYERLGLAEDFPVTAAAFDSVRSFWESLQN